MTRYAAFVLAFLLGAGVAFAQANRGPAAFPVQGTVAETATVFWIRDAGRTSIVLLPAGTVVTVIGRADPWYKVVFRTASGDETGYMAPHDIRIDPDATPRESSARRGVTQRGLIEGRGFGFPQTSPTDDARVYGDALLREELFLKPARWLQFAVGADVRASSHDQVADDWDVDIHDRGVLRPRIALRRLGVAVNTRHFGLDLGKQFIRWGMADVLSPTDRFAPRDYLNVVDSEFLPVAGARASVHAGGDTLEVVWVPRLTPSRLPLLDQRWTVVPPEAAGFVLEDQGSLFPSTSQQGVRWSHVGRFEMALSAFDGFDHLAAIQAVPDPGRGVLALTRTYAALRSYGGEIIAPTRVVTVKGEAAYFTSPDSTTSEYVLYVIEIERQVGEWLFDVGYAGEVVTTSRDERVFSAERGMARSIIGRVSYTVNPRRTVAIEGAVRQDGRGVYMKGEFSQAFAQHWRLVLTAAGISGHTDDFLGQYHRNSHASAAFRFSF